MKYFISLMMALILVLTACGQSEKEQVEKGKTENKLVQKEKKIKPAAKKQIAYKAAAKKQLNTYLKVLPTAFNNDDYTLIKPYIAKGSEAEKYIKKNMPTGQFHRYQIEKFTIDKVSENGRKATVTRWLSSNATHQQLMKVITIFDMKYDKKLNKMLITDFNDQSTSQVVTPSTEQQTVEQQTSEVPETEQQADAERCIMSNFETGCIGLTQDELMTTYNELVEKNKLPKAPATDCIQCAVQESLDIKNGVKDSEESPEAAVTAEQAVAMVDAQYRKSVEEYNDESDVSFVLAGDKVEQDVSGKYYVVKAIDNNLTEADLLQTFKVYIDSGEVIAE